jgi:hypothetical protein
MCVSEAVADEIDARPRSLCAELNQFTAKPTHDQPTKERQDECNNREVAIFVIDEFDLAFGLSRAYQLLEAFLPFAKGSDAMHGDNEMGGPFLRPCLGPA